MTPNTELSDERLNVKSGPFKGKPQQWFTRAEVLALLAASPAPLREADEARSPAGTEGTIRERSLAMMIRVLCSRRPDGTFTISEKKRERALDLLRSMGLQGSPLRAAAPSGIEADGDGGKVIAAFELAMKQTWQMVGPLSTPPAGSYYMGEHNGIIAALRTVRANFNRALSPTSPPNGKTEGDGGWAGVCTLQQNGEPRCGKQCGVCSDGVDASRGGEQQ
jgi:hypothetical protein